MRSKIDAAASWLFVVTICALTVLYLSSAVPAAAQTGQNAVYNGASPVPSPSFIDASQFANLSRDFCGVLHFVMTTGYPATGAVIDARAVPTSTPPTNMTCAASPWAGITNPPPSTILLPAGTIQISTSWVLPSNTRLIGEGESDPLSAVPGTTIQAASNVQLQGGTMIQFGSSAVCGSSGCGGISVERLTLDGQAKFLNGIGNSYSQNNTYVDHVTLYQILGTGLLISGPSAANSGPYTNIIFDTGTYSGTSGTVCAQIIGTGTTVGTGGTKGIHGLMCKSETNDAPAAVLLDDSNNSIEDVKVVGFHDGVLVGSNAAAQNNVLVNIIGDTSCGGLCTTTPINAIHIAPSNVTNLSIIGVSNSNMTGSNTIEDEETLPAPHFISDASVAMYAIGEPIGGGAYTRYTTSLKVPHWTVGTSAPNTSPQCSRGSLYSCTTPSSGGNVCTHALWVCGPSGWVFVK